jgi:hypothetical protein
MIDRENVIKAIECRKSADKRCGNPCEDTGACYYATSVRGLDGEIYRPFVCDKDQLFADILELLKEQEAEKVVNMMLSKDKFLIASCPKCNALLTRVEHKNYCGYCGKAVKWE